MIPLPALEALEKLVLDRPLSYHYEACCDYAGGNAHTITEPHSDGSVGFTAVCSATFNSEYAVDQMKAIVALVNAAPSLIAEAKKAQGYRELVEEVAKERCHSFDEGSKYSCLSDLKLCPEAWCLPCRAREALKLEGGEG